MRVQPRQPDPSVRRAGWALAALFCLASLWPAIVSGGALWFDDLSPYVKGGRAAIETVLDARGSSADQPAEPTAGPTAEQPAAGVAGGLAARVAAPVSGVRSIAYSLLAYLAALPAPRFWALAALQAGCVGTLLAAFVRREGGPLWLYGALYALGAGPVFASTASPDVWAGILLLAVLLLVRHRATLSRPGLVFAGACVAFAVAAHASHVLLATALMLAAWAGAVLQRANRGRTGLSGGTPLAAGVALGVVGVLATSLVGFGEASLAPKRYPIVLARAIEDGPALWHLEAHCDEHAYAVCEVFPGPIPDTVGSFLWEDGGLRDLASPGQMDRVRAEEALIIRRALAEYPFFQARRALSNVAEQATLVAAPPRLGLVAARRGGGDAVRVGRRFAPGADRVLVVTQGLGIVLGLAGLSGTLVLGHRRLGPDEWTLLVLTAAGLLANAAICGVLSVPDPRYQARVAWVLPLVCVALLFAPPTDGRFRRAVQGRRSAADPSSPRGSDDSEGP